MKLQKYQIYFVQTIEYMYSVFKCMRGRFFPRSNVGSIRSNVVHRHLIGFLTCKVLHLSGNLSQKSWIYLLNPLKCRAPVWGW